MKLHLGCGPVYLRGYVNIDIKGDLAKHRPDIVKENITTVKKYFKKPYKFRPLGHDKRGKIVVDILTDITALPMIGDGSVSEILSVNVINHLHYQDFLIALKEWHRVLKTGGLLISDYDDVVKNCLDVVLANPTVNFKKMERALRYLFCHGRDEYDSHYWGYPQWYLNKIMSENGFRFVRRDDTYIHHDADYPRLLLIHQKL